ncbi:MAG: prepilin-type N-terminal cleavage/methylation domain-containing protein [Desulfobacteraceae bacterium]|nr:MAG: prepilin-type N-terminal cleavage/methylation domain-containing protein [Desulfobacteraceae bacterium]
MNRQNPPSGFFSRHSRQGFTLLEILIAIFIFSIVITTIFGTFNAVISRTESIKNGTGDYEMARTCLNRMVSDLSAIYIDQKPLYEPPDFDDDPDPYGFVGKSEFYGGKSFSQLRFASTEHLSMTGKIENGIAEIVYYVKEINDPDTGTQYVLKRSDTLYPEKDAGEFEPKDSDPVLCENIEELTFVYFDAEGKEYEEWDSDSDNVKYATPSAVEIRLKIANGAQGYPFTTTTRLPVYRDKIE